MRSAAPILAVSLALASLQGGALAQNLVANPVLMRDLPPPGWIADRRAEWIAQHAVYRSTCQTPEVATEIAFLNRVVGRDEMLLNLAGNPPPGNGALAREAQLANRDMGMIRNDIETADGLVTQLQALPTCAPAAAAKEAASAATPTPSEPPAPPNPAPGTGQTLTLRFDDKVAALTPRSIRIFDQAVEAARAGKPVRLAIDGCGQGADFSMGTVCGERRRSLVAMLKENGVRQPNRLFADAP